MNDIPQTTEHLKALLTAAQDFGVRLCVLLPQSAPTAFPPANNPRPFIAIVLDDDESPVGPDGFDRESFSALVQTVDCAAVVSTAPVLDIYKLMALMPSYLRAGTLIIETRASHDLVWARYLQGLKPNLPIICSTPEPQKMMGAQV